MKKGISLIVLVVTIIIMTIISGAIIITLTETDIIDKAETAVDKYNLAELNSEARMLYNDYLIKEELEGENYLVGSHKYIVDELVKNGSIKREDLPDYYITKTGIVERVDRTSLITVWRISEDGETFVLPMSGIKGTIDWGDNTTDTYTTAKSQPTHVYAKSGDYEIKIKGTLNAITKPENDVVEKRILLAVKSWGEVGIKKIGVYSMDIEVLPYPSDKSFEQLVEFGIRKTSIENLPDNFFVKATKLRNLTAAFSNNTKLKSIPENLFLSEITTASIELFAGCINLRGNAPAFWDKAQYPNISPATENNNWFMGCKNLTNYNEIPALWGGGAV